MAFTLQDAGSCPSWWWFGTQLPEVCITTTLGHHLHSPGSCMLQETFLYQLGVLDLLLQFVSTKHHLLSSSKSPVDCSLGSGDPASSCLAQPPLSSHPHSHISWLSQMQNLLIVDLTPYRKLSTTAQHTIPSLNLPQQRAGPGSTWATQDLPITRRKPAQLQRRETSAERPCIYLFVEEESRSLWVCACMCLSGQ